MLLTNPFHLLGLPADATAKERSERESRIRAYLEVGKPLEFGEQDVVLGAKRNAGNVNQAFKSMQAADARMGSGFFWFTRSGMLDEQALGLLAEDKRDQCREVLNKLEGREPTSGYFSSVMNLGTFRMLEALLVRDGAGFISGLNIKMKALGAVEESVLLEWARSIGDEISSSDVDKVLSHFEPAFESVRKEAERYGLKVSPSDWTSALKAGGSRFGSMEEAMASGPRAKVMEAISMWSEGPRGEGLRCHCGGGCYARDGRAGHGGIEGGPRPGSRCCLFLGGCGGKGVAGMCRGALELCSGGGKGDGVDHR